MKKTSRSTVPLLLPTAGAAPETPPTARQRLQTVSLWREEQLTALSHLATKRQLEMVSHLPSTELWGAVSHLSMPNYQPDRAIRAAVLAPHAWRRWRKDGTDYLAYRYPMNPMKDLHVFLGGVRPPSLEEGTEIVKAFRLSMVLTGRICLAVWLSRRREDHLSQTGSALINLDEILAIRGMKKSRTIIHHGERRDISYSNGYRWEDKQAILEDLMLLQQCYVQGECAINIDGQWHYLGVDDQYLRFSLLTRKTSWGTEEKLGIFVTAGNWINAYEANNNIYVAEVEREVFKLNPQQDFHELLLGLYLTERWRDLARKEEYAKPISMKELLEGSMISVDRKNPSRFIKRIDDALESLFARGILGIEAHCLNPADRTQLRWTEAWLASQWVLLPPESVVEHYHRTIAGPLPAITALPSPKKTRQARKKG